MNIIHTTGKVYLVWGQYGTTQITQITLERVCATREGAEKWIEKHRNDSVVRYEIHEEEVES